MSLTTPNVGNNSKGVLPQARCPASQIILSTTCADRWDKDSGVAVPLVAEERRLACEQGAG
jgi:hypothetical protein